MAPSDPSLTLPRIICLHGGGTSSPIFALQCRTLLPYLTPHFRLVFIDGPFPCPPHPAIAPIYGDHGPFYRWLRWLPEHPYLDAQQTSLEVLDCIAEGMGKDEGTGEWVGLLGFSQGAKVGAGLLWLHEEIARKGGRGIPILGQEVRFRFGIFMAGSGPVTALDPRGELEGKVPRGVDTADTLGAVEFREWPGDDEGEWAIGTETLHVHGLRDEGLEEHRRLVRLYCKRGTARVVEWDGGHRVVFFRGDVEVVVQGILDLARRTEVLE